MSSLPATPPPGLCGDCRHARTVPSARGATFLLCERATSDARYPKYPPLPVSRCEGWEREEQSGADGR